VVSDNSIHIIPPGKRSAIGRPSVPGPPRPANGT